MGRFLSLLLQLLLLLLQLLLLLRYDYTETITAVTIGYRVRDHADEKVRSCFRSL